MNGREVIANKVGLVGVAANEFDNVHQIAWPPGSKFQLDEAFQGDIAKQRPTRTELRRVWDRRRRFLAGGSRPFTLRQYVHLHLSLFVQDLRPSTGLLRKELKPRDGCHAQELFDAIL